jgi:hypothetical protein
MNFDESRGKRGSTEQGVYNGNTINFSDAGWVRTDTVYTYNADGELVDQSEYDEEGMRINTSVTGIPFPIRQ